MQTILVVDDDPAISVIAAEALRDEGSAVVSIHTTSGTIWLISEL
jgi:CheY-like chemotaxis protein